MSNLFFFSRGEISSPHYPDYYPAKKVKFIPHLSHTICHSLNQIKSNYPDFYPAREVTQHLFPINLILKLNFCTLRSACGFSQRRPVTVSSCCSPNLSWNPTRNVYYVEVNHLTSTIRSVPTTTSLCTTDTRRPNRFLEGLF